MSLYETHPTEALKLLAKENGLETTSKEFAKMMDSHDDLSHIRNKFAIPKKKTLVKVDPVKVEDLNEDCIYMCGNSLGLKPIKADQYIQAQLDKWANIGVEMHFEEPLPAATCDEYGREMMSKLVGAAPETVVLMNGLTVNLHLLLISFYQPTNTRYKILLEKHAFPSDRYAIRSQVEIRGYNPNDAVLELAPRKGEETLRHEDILEVLERHGKSISVVCLSGIQYYTGQKFQMGEITRVAQQQGCTVGWDLAHAVGNIELKLDEWDVDFACWCTYKYLNSGPGCIGGAYVNSRHKHRNVPHLRGWWSNKKDTRFLMKDVCDVAEGIDAFRLCNPPPFLVALVMASLDIFEEVGMDRMLKKQFLLTGYLELLLNKQLSNNDLGNVPPATIITPNDPSQRGCQLSVEFSFNLDEVHTELEKRGVVCDVRKPNVMRLAPAPLYNSFEDVYKLVSVLEEVIKTFK